MDTELYHNTLEYPAPPTRPVLVKNATPDQIRKHADLVEKYEAEKRQCNASREVYGAENRRLYEKFKADALEELGLTGHPKGNLLFEKAWGMGHLSGFSEVWIYMQDLSELLT